jgi:hypothetical protein
LIEQHQVRYLPHAQTIETLLTITYDLTTQMLFSHAVAARENLLYTSFSVKKERHIEYSTKTLLLKSFCSYLEWLQALPD